MFKDDELDRLERERDRIFRLLKEARDERKRQGQACTRMHFDLDEAYKVQQLIYQSDQSAWERHRSSMQDCSRKIQTWSEEADRHHSQMTNAFAESQRSWNSGDKSGAKSWSESGKQHQAQMRHAKGQVAYWVSQSKAAQMRFGGGQSSEMARAKARTKQLKIAFDLANSQLKEAKAVVERLERQLENARSRFSSRLEQLKRESAVERQRRLEREAARKSYRLARALELDQAQRSRDIQAVSGDGLITSKVKQGWSRKYNMPCTDILIFQRGVRGHHHIVIGEDGNVFIDEWRDK